MKNKKYFVCLTIGFFFLFGANFAISQAEFNWQQLNGPEGGTIQALAVNSHGHIFAGSPAGGVFRSEDNGETWSHLTTHRVLSIAIDYADNIFICGYCEVYYSYNGGNTWTRANCAACEAWAVAVNSQGYVFVGADNGIFRSQDSGLTWELVNTGLTHTNIRSLAVNSSDTLFAGSPDGGLYCSTDNGNSWTPIAALEMYSVVSIAIRSDGNIFVGTYPLPSSPQGLIFCSSDEGSTWWEVPKTNFNGYYVSAFAFKDNYIFVGCHMGISALYRSVDGVFDWETVGLESRTVWSFAINSTGDIFAGTRGDGVYRSIDDGDSWDQINTDLIATDVRSLAINSSGHIFAATSWISIKRSTDSGESWVQLNPESINDVVCYESIVINSYGHIFAGGPFISRSTDNGSSWTHNYTLGGCLALDSDENVFVGTGNGVYRSTDNGDTYHHIGLASHWVRSIAVNSSGHIFAGTNDKGLWHSTDNGTSWAQLAFPDDWIICITIGPDDEMLISPYHSYGIYRSTDNGSNWTKIYNYHANTLAINDEGHIFAGFFNNGVWCSMDDGNSWAEINSGLINLFIRDFAFDQDGYIYVGTGGNGIFRSEESTLPYTLENLIKEVQKSSIHHGIKNSLLKKLENAQKSVEKGNINAAINQLRAFQNEVRAQSGKKIPVELADRWLMISEKIIQELQEQL